MTYDFIALLMFHSLVFSVSDSCIIPLWSSFIVLSICEFGFWVVLLGLSLGDCGIRIRNGVRDFRENVFRK